MSPSDAAPALPYWMPPRGIFIPNEIIFNTQLSPAVILTWIQLRCLAWQGWSTPPMALAELASRLGIHPARLNRHIDHLQSISALSWKTVETGKIILSFPDVLINAQGKSVETEKPKGPGWSNLQDTEVLHSSSYFPEQIMGYLKFQDGQGTVEPMPEPGNEQILLLEKADLCTNC